MVLEARAIPCSTAFSKLFSDVELISTTRATDIYALPRTLANYAGIPLRTLQPQLLLRSEKGCRPIVAMPRRIDEDVLEFDWMLAAQSGCNSQKGLRAGP